MSNVKVWHLQLKGRRSKKPFLILRNFLLEYETFFSDSFLKEITKPLGVRPHDVQGLGIARQLCEVILEQIGPVIHFLSGAHKITAKIDSILFHW